MKKLLVFFSLGLLIICSLSCSKNKDKNEPNNSFSNAKKISLGKDEKMSIYPQDDIDFFKFTVKTPGIIFVEAGNNKPGNINLIATVFNSSHEMLISNQEIPFKTGLGKGNYFISIFSSLNNIEEDTLFNIKLNSTEVMLDEFEPNNTNSEAKEIEINSEVEINLFPIGDKDIFKFQIKENSVLEFLKEFQVGKEKVDVKTSIFNSSGNCVLDNKSIPLEIELAPGKYLLQISLKNTTDFYRDIFKIKINRINK